MTNDAELLREYVESQSDAAFAELVGRHVKLVYSTAFRMVREAALAQDIVQSVFVQLARDIVQAAFIHPALKAST
jgi:DNA-directed RNA polymerase specialized sigma24 family protein